MSDLVGYVLIFAVIVTAIGVISTGGLSALEEARADELARNTDRSFVLLAQNFQELETGAAPRRTSAFELRSGTLSIADGPSFRFEIARPSHPNFDTTVRTRRLEHEISGEVIGYENGGTFRGPTEGNNSVVQVEPGFVCGPDYAIVSTVRLVGDTRQHVSGGVARISATRLNSTLLYPLNRTTTGPATASNSTQLNVTVDSTFLDGWEQFFTREDNRWRQTDADTFVCEVGPEGVVYLRRTVLEVTIGH